MSSGIKCVFTRAASSLSWLTSSESSWSLYSSNLVSISWMTWSARLRSSIRILRVKFNFQGQGIYRSVLVASCPLRHTSHRPGPCFRFDLCLIHPMIEQRLNKWVLKLWFERELIKGWVNPCVVLTVHFLSCSLVSGWDVDDSVGVNVKGNLDLRNTSWCWWNTSEL